MATVYTPPIDLYAESHEDRREKQDTPDRRTTQARHPMAEENGYVDQPAVEQSHMGLERVLGW